MAHISEGRATRQLVVRVTDEEYEALKQWAIAEERSLSAQTRMALRDVVPAKYYTPRRSEW